MSRAENRSPIRISPGLQSWDSTLTAFLGLVVEDAPSGLLSGRDAGAKTLGVCTTHTREALEKIQPDYIVADLTSVSVRWVDNQLEVTIPE